MPLNWVSTVPGEDHYSVNFRVVVDTDSFNFNVTLPVVAPEQNYQNSWRLIENGFRK